MPLMQMLGDTIWVQAQTDLVVGYDGVGFLLLRQDCRLLGLLLQDLGLERRLEAALIC